MDKISGGSKKYSLKNLLVFFFVLLTAVLLMGFLLLTIYLANTSKTFVRNHHADLLNGYVDTLNRNIENLNDFNQNISSINYDFQALNKKGKIEQKLLHENNLRNMLSYRTCSTGAIFVYDASGEIEIYRFGFDYKTRDFLNNVKIKENILDFCKKMDVEECFKWITLEIDGKVYLLNVFQYGNLKVCSMIDLERTASYINSTNQDESIYFVFKKEDQFITDLGDFYDVDDGRAGYRKDTIHFWGNSYVISGETISNSGISLCIVEKISLLNTYSKLALIILFITFIVVFAVVFILFRIMTRYLFYPLHQIGTATELLMEANGERSKELSGDKVKPTFDNSLVQIVEVDRINLALLNLIQKKIHLEKENLRKQKEKEHAQLQYYQLQTRSHFFLNCLKSLYGMLEAEQYSRMQRMIIAFSNHIRYIFHDNVMQVTLKQEMTEVNDYYNIIALDREKPIMLVQNIDDELMEVMVPPLIVQTFLENSIKYSAIKDSVLQVVITGEKNSQPEGEYLKLKIVDNGKGFSFENLEKLNSVEDYSYEQYHVGINNLKRRLQLIYGKDFSIHFYNGINGGACVIIYVPFNTTKR